MRRHNLRQLLCHHLLFRLGDVLFQLFSQSRMGTLAPLPVLERVCRFQSLSPSFEVLNDSAKFLHHRRTLGHTSSPRTFLNLERSSRVQSSMRRGGRGVVTLI